MERRHGMRRWAIAVALLAHIPEERLLSPHAIAASTR